MTEPAIQRKIDPARRPASATALDVSAPGNPAHREWAEAGLDAPDIEAIRAYRLGRLRAELAKRNCAGAVLFDPLNVRYATDCPNMQVWCLHNAVRYAFVATEGPVVLFDFHSCAHLSADLELIDETRPAIPFFYYQVGDREQEMAARWASEIGDLLRAAGGNRLAVDKCEIAGIDALRAAGIEVVAGQGATERARKIKHADEIKAMRRAIHACETGMAAMWQALEPGITENQLWSILHQANIARGGEWIETACCPAVPAPTRGSASAPTGSSRPAISSPSIPTSSVPMGIAPTSRARGSPAAAGRPTSRRRCTPSPWTSWKPTLRS